MKIISKSVKMLTVFLLVLGITGCSDDDDGNQQVTTTTVVDVAVSEGFTSLAEALIATDLVATLEGAGPFTVFAPTNDAFTTFLNAQGLDLDNLTTDQEELVRQVLLNHVIVGSELDAAAITGSAPDYVNTGASGVGNTNLSLFYNLDGTTVQLNGGSSTSAGANVTTTDVQADNGVIHELDKVLTLPTIVDMAIANPSLSSLVAALQRADTAMMPTVNWINTVSGTENDNLSPFTVFAPTNDAFAALLLELDDTGMTALSDVEPATVDAILTLHVVTETNVQSSGLGALNGVIPTLGGDLDLDGTTITDVNGRTSEILAPDLVDIQATNGVVHAIDIVLLPQQ